MFSYSEVVASWHLNSEPLNIIRGSDIINSYAIKLYPKSSVSAGRPNLADGEYYHRVAMIAGVNKALRAAVLEGIDPSKACLLIFTECVSLHARHTIAADSSE